MRRLVLPLLAILATTAATAQLPSKRGGFSVSITEPENQGIVFGKSRIAAEVSIDRADQIDRVEFLVGDDVVFVDREPPWECTHDFGEEAQSHIVRAVAYHVEKVSVTDAVITRRVPFVEVERVDRVVLWLSASDGSGNFITDLTGTEITIAEGKRPQTIREFKREERPITMAILLDSSASMKERLREVHRAASSFVDTLRDEDRAALIDFDDKVFLISDLTSDREHLKEAIESTEAIGGTAIYDALHAAYRKVGSIRGRRAIVLLSDGDDTSSQFGFKRVLEEAKTNNSIIYAIGLGDGSGGARRSVLREFAEVTGGRAFFVKKADELQDVYQRIAEELRTQYVVSYQTDNEEWDGRWIPLTVETTRKGVEVRARRGYFAVRSSRAAGASGSSSGISSSADGS